MSEEQEKKSAINWDSKNAPYEAYLDILQQYRTLSFVLKQKRGLRKIYPKYQSSLATFRMTVLSQFSKYMDSPMYKKDFPNSKITKEDFQELHNCEILPNKLLEMTEILLFWAQEHGPFATLTDHLDPRKGW